MDILHKALKFADHNRYVVAGFVLALALMICFVSCTPTTNSVLLPGEKVTVRELEREAVTIKSDYAEKVKLLKVAQEDIEEQIAFRTQIIGIVGSLGDAAVAGTISPTTGLAAAMQLLTLTVAGGALLDNRRKDKKIAAAKPSTPPPVPPQPPV